jgi:WD40 repeat protein
MQQQMVANNSNHQQQGAADTGANGDMGMNFDLEKFVMEDSGDFAELSDMFAGDDEGGDSNMLMAAEGNDMDPFGGGFLASMGGGTGVDANAATHTNGQPIQLYCDLQGHTTKVSTCTFTLDGSWLASAGHDKKVLVWNVAEKKLALSLEGHSNQVTNARFSPDNRNYLATGSYDKSLRIWDVGAALSSGSMSVQAINKFDCKTQVTAVDFSPDRPEIVCSLDAEGELKVWNLTNSQCEKIIRMVSERVHLCQREKMVCCPNRWL